MREVELELEEGGKKEEVGRRGEEMMNMKGEEDGDVMWLWNAAFSAVVISFAVFSMSFAILD